jgi:hypothetical protein
LIRQLLASYQDDFNYAKTIKKEVGNNLEATQKEIDKADINLTLADKRNKELK